VLSAKAGPLKQLKRVEAIRRPTFYDKAAKRKNESQTIELEQHAI
jgi:hypothetical protein